MLMKLVDLKSRISQELATAAAKGMISGATQEMHLPVTTEGGQLKVVVVPLQSGPGVDGKYGTPEWGGADEGDRSENYHDPKVPGSTQVDEADGQLYVWVKEEGYVLASSVPGANETSGAAVLAAHKAIDDVVAAFQAK